MSFLEVYSKKIADQFVDLLKKGEAPIQQIFAPGFEYLPYNPKTGHVYRGTNAIVLGSRSEGDARWLTYKQSQEIGGQVRDNERGVRLIHWSMTKTEVLRGPDGKPLRDEEGRSLKITTKLQRPRFFSFFVFNAEQIDGLPNMIPAAVPVEEKIAALEKVLRNAGATLLHRATMLPRYSPSKDEIVMPPPEAFADARNYYRVVLHELAHSTGHESRLNRDLTHPFGSEGYAKEELRAEIASYMLGSHYGLGFTPSAHASYVQSWIKVLRDDPTELNRASRDAEKIKEFIVGLEHEREISQMTEHQAEIKSPSSQLNDRGARLFLVVPFEEKDLAKEAGARWDRQVKQWFVETNDKAAIERVARWLSENNLPHPLSEDPLQQFKEEAKAAGLLLSSEIVADGNFHHVPVDGNSNGKKSGSYFYNSDGPRAYGYIENFKTGERIKWVQGIVAPLSEEEKTRLKLESEKARQEREAAKERKHKEAAEIAKSIWNNAPPAHSDNDYCQKKGILNPASKGLREILQVPRQLLIPLVDATGEIKSLQMVTSDTKRFLKDGQKTGHFAIAGSKDQVLQTAFEAHINKPLIFAEGYSTADTLAEILQQPVIVTFGQGNLSHVVSKLKNFFPEREVIIAADNDHKSLKNTGIAHAEAVAKTNGGLVIFPDFHQCDNGSDWNDFATINGFETAKKCFDLKLETERSRLKERSSPAAEVRGQRNMSEKRGLGALDRGGVEL